MDDKESYHHIAGGTAAVTHIVDAGAWKNSPPVVINRMHYHG
jgi:hypothetical protein